MDDPNPIVIVIDDDAAFRRSTERLILSVGYKVQTFAAAGEFLRNPRPEAPACLLLDVRLPGLSGLDLQRELVTAGVQIPIIFITGHGDIPMSVQAMKAGAVEFSPSLFASRICSTPSNRRLGAIALPATWRLSWRVCVRVTNC